MICKSNTNVCCISILFVLLVILLFIRFSYFMLTFIEKKHIKKSKLPYNTKKRTSKVMLTDNYNFKDINNVKNSCDDEIIKKIIVKNTGWSDKEYENNKTNITDIYLTNLLLAYKILKTFHHDKTKKLKDSISRINLLIKDSTE